MHKIHRRKARTHTKPKRKEIVPKRNPVIWISATVAVLLIVMSAFGVWLSSEEKPSGPLVTVYKSATCGCCKKWIKHLESEGFSVESHNESDMDAIKKQYDIAADHRSCHTALVNGYVIEGHVPAADIKRLIAQKLELKGLVVPGMPMGSPGMEGRRVDHYEVLSINKDNRETVFNTYN